MIFASIDSEVAAPPWDTPPPPSAPQGPKRKLSKLGTQFQEATKEEAAAVATSMSNRWLLTHETESIGTLIVTHRGVTDKRTGGVGAFTFAKNLQVSTATHMSEDGVTIMATVAAGEITNIHEVREELYGVPIDKTKRESSAQLLMDLYLKGFSDQYGDLTDQPATALACIQGAFTFVLLDADAGYCLAARSGPDAPALYWGNTETGTMVFSGDEAAIGSQVAPNGAVSPFPGGCFFECSRADPRGRLMTFTRRIQHRAVQPVNRIGSHGQLCGLGFYTQSGTDLASAVGGAH